MDAEGLKSLLWFVIFGALFFVMMRYGCGAHIGGHRHRGHHGGEGPPERGGATKDPVRRFRVLRFLANAGGIQGGAEQEFGGDPHDRHRLLPLPEAVRCDCDHPAASLVLSGAVFLTWINRRARGARTMRKACPGELR